MKIYKVYKPSGSDPVENDKKPVLIATTNSVITAVLACKVDAHSELSCVETFKKVRDYLNQVGSCILVVNRIGYLIEAHFTVSESEDDEMYYCQSINLVEVK